jgi:hypothetical protein
MIPIRYDFHINSDTVTYARALDKADARIQDVEDIHVHKTPKPAVATIDQQGRVIYTSPNFSLDVEGCPVVPKLLIGGDIVERVHENAVFDAIARSKQGMGHYFAKKQLEHHPEGHEDEVSRMLQQILTDKKKGRKTASGLKHMSNLRNQEIRQSSLERELAASRHEVLAAALSPRPAADVIDFAVCSVRLYCCYQI